MKGHQGDPVTTHVTFSQQDLNRALGLGQPVQGRGTRRIDHKNRGRRRTLDPAHDAEIIGTDFDPGAAPFASAQALPGRSSAQGRDQIEPGTTTRIAPLRSIRTTATWVRSRRADPTGSLLRSRPAARRSGITQLREQTGRQSRPHRFEHHLGQWPGLIDGVGRLRVGRIRIEPRFFACIHIRGRACLLFVGIGLRSGRRVRLSVGRLRRFAILGRRCSLLGRRRRIGHIGRGLLGRRHASRPRRKQQAGGDGNIVLSQVRAALERRSNASSPNRGEHRAR